MAHRQINRFVFAPLAATAMLAICLVSPSFAADDATAPVAETTATETSAVPAAEEAPQKEESAAVEPAAPAAPAPAPALEPAPAAPAAPIQERPAAALVGPVTDQTLVVAPPSSGIAAEVPGETEPIVAQAPTFSIETHVQESQVYGTGWLSIQQTNKLASNGHRLTATINGSGSFVSTFRAKTILLDTDANHGSYYTEYVMCAPEGALITVSDATGNVVASQVGLGNTAANATVLPRYCPEGIVGQPTKQTVEVTPEGADVTLAGEGIRGSVVPKGTPGVVYTIDRPDAFDGVVTLTAAPAPEDASFKYVFPAGVTTSWTYNLGTYTEPSVDPDPGNDPMARGSYDSGSFSSVNEGSYVYGGTLTAKGALSRDANISFTLTDGGGNKLPASQTFDPWNGKSPLVLDEKNLAAQCGQIVSWAWVSTDSGEQGSGQTVLFSGTTHVPACPLNPSDGHEDDDDSEVDEGGDHENGGWVPGDTDQPGGWNGHVGGPGFYGPGHPDNVVEETVVLTPAGVEASADSESDYDLLASVGAGESDLDESWEGSSVDGGVLAETGFTVQDWLVAAASVLSAGLLAMLLARRRKVTIQ